MLCISQCLPYRYLADDTERLQKRALWIILPDLNYREALEKTNITRLSDRSELLTKELFHHIFGNGQHKLYQLLPKTIRKQIIELRSRGKFVVPAFNTDRLKNLYRPSVMFELHCACTKATDTFKHADLKCEEFFFR